MKKRGDKMSRRDYFREENKLKRITIVFGITLFITMLVFIVIFNVYNRKLMEDAQKNLLELGSVNAVVPNSNVIEITNPVSVSRDKGINEIKNQNKVEKEVIKQDQNINENIVNNVPDTKNEVVENEIIEEKALEFMAPVNGEIIKDFATETLVYSKTLEEWTTHNGIDIRADKTAIIVSAESGVIESIKNDPRYGLTVTITHKDGFKTIYSNLLSTEFITEGETVEKGQTIATVGESSSFEIADETHLHFEMIKDGEYVNPTIYLK